MKEKLCGACRRFKRAPWWNRLWQYFSQCKKKVKYIKIRGACHYCKTDFIYVYEDELGCVHWEVK